MTTITGPELEAELAGEERAIRHLIGERAALTSKIKRAQAREQLLETQLRHLPTRGHPAIRPASPAIPHGERFPDVSSYQPNVDWSAIATARSVRVGRLAFAKITEGTSWTDALGARRWREMAARRMNRGGYAFLHPSESPVAQAEHLLATLYAAGDKVRETDILAADLEVSDGQPARVVQACAREFGAHLRKNTPAKLWLYTGGPFAREHGLALDPYDAHWVPAYVGDPAPYMAFGRARTVAWQYTDGRYGPTPHVCPGIGAGDLSIVL